MKPELLPDELWWASPNESGRHASDVVLTALADGQLAIVPDVVKSHVEGCGQCTAHLGNAVLLSMYTARELEAVKKVASEETALARRPLPRLAIALGLAVAFVGLVPSMIEPPKFVSPHEVKVLFSGASTLGHGVMEGASTISLALTYGLAALLFGFGFVLVRLLPKKETSS